MRYVYFVYFLIGFLILKCGFEAQKECEELGGTLVKVSGLMGRSKCVKVKEILD